MAEKRLQNQPNASDIQNKQIWETPLPGGDAAPQQTKPTASVVNNPGDFPMKQLSDFPQTRPRRRPSPPQGRRCNRLFRDEAPLTTPQFITLADSGFMTESFFTGLSKVYVTSRRSTDQDPSKKDLWGHR